MAQRTAAKAGKAQLCLKATELLMRGWVTTYFYQLQCHSGESKVYSSCPVVGKETEPSLMGRDLLSSSRRKEKHLNPKYATKGFSKAQSFCSALAQSGRAELQCWERNLL